LAWCRSIGEDEIFNWGSHDIEGEFFRLKKIEKLPRRLCDFLLRLFERRFRKSQERDAIKLSKFFLEPWKNASLEMVIIRETGGLLLSKSKI